MLCILTAVKREVVAWATSWTLQPSSQQLQEVVAERRDRVCEYLVDQEMEMRFLIHSAMCDAVQRGDVAGSLDTWVSLKRARPAVPNRTLAFSREDFNFENCVLSKLTSSGSSG